MDDTDDWDRRRHQELLDLADSARLDLVVIAGNAAGSGEPLDDVYDRFSIAIEELGCEAAALSQLHPLTESAAALHSAAVTCRALFDAVDGNRRGTRPIDPVLADQDARALPFAFAAMLQCAGELGTDLGVASDEDFNLLNP